MQYEIYSGNSDNIKEHIERGSLDLGLLVEPVDIRDYEFVRMPVKEEWGILIKEDAELASRETISPQDLLGIPLIFTRREQIQNEILNWFGAYADQIEMVASGNLLYNLAVLARSGIGVVVSLRLDCQYDDLRYIPLSPKLESGTVLVWKKAQTFSKTTEEFIKYAKKCLKSISEDAI